MKVFVTGGTGLLGNAILRELNAAGHATVSLVRSNYDSAIFEGIDTEFVSGDLLDHQLMSNVIESSLMVSSIHLRGPMMSRSST